MRATPDTLPKVFGRYLLVSRLSRGGMGEIFLSKTGELAGFQKLCVIKKVLPTLAEDQDFIGRFIDEAQVAIQLAHANIASVFEVGRVDGEYFLALEYVEGRDLRRVLASLSDRGLRLPVDLALWIVRDVASGLAYAHRKTGDDGLPLNLVHCDISPPNVVLSYEGEVKLIDFGIAKSAVRISQSNPSIGFGKFGYMAPEQLIRGAEVDRRTDLYAAGVILYELLTGEKLFTFPEGADYRTIASTVASGAHPLPSHRDPALAPFDALVAKAVHSDPTHRFSSAEELRDAVQSALVSVNPTMTSDRLGTFMRDTFAADRASEREVLRAVTELDLTDFATELTGPQTQTVTFARADVPGISPTPAPDLPGLPPPGSRRPATAPPRAHVPIGDDDDDEPTIAVEPPVKPVPRRRAASQTVLVGVPTGRRRSSVRRGILLVTPFLLGVLLTVILVKGQGESAPPRADAAPLFIVTPVAPLASPDAAQATAATADAALAAVATPDAAPRRVHRPPPTARDAAPTPTKNPLDRDAIKARFQALGRAYAAFSKQYGNRFEAEWTAIHELLNFGQGDAQLDDLDHRLRELEAKMDRVRRGRDP